MYKSLTQILEQDKDVVFSVKKMIEHLYDFEAKDLEENVQMLDEDAFMFDLKTTATFKNIAYVTPYGNVKGNLTVSKDIVTFNPTNIEELQEMIATNQKQNAIGDKGDEKNKQGKKPLIKLSDFYLNIEIFDIYSINTYVVEFDTMKNYNDIYMDLFLETANGMNKPLQDTHGNKFLLKVTFKSASHYNQIDIEELQKRLREQAIKDQELEEDLNEIDTQDTGSENNNLQENPIPAFQHHECQSVHSLQQFDNSPQKEQSANNKQKIIGELRLQCENNDSGKNEELIKFDDDDDSNSKLAKDSPSRIIPSNKDKLQIDLNHLRRSLNAQLYRKNRIVPNQKKGTVVGSQANSMKQSIHMSLKKINVPEKKKKIKLYSLVGFTFIHFLEIKLRYLINEMGYQQNDTKESGTFVFFFEKIFYKYVNQINYSYIFTLDQEYIPTRNEESFIFGEDDDRYFTQIIQNLPSIFQLSDWSLSYSPNKHGYSYNEFLFRCSAVQSPHVMIIKDTKDNLFGAYASNGWRKSRNFYGDGESFLFKFEHIDQLQDKKIKVFRWTGQNNCIQYCGNEGIAMGIGENYGLFVNRDFYKGLSFPTFTFGNMLGLHIQNNETFESNKKISIQGEFQIKEIEFWSLDPYLVEKMNSAKKPSLLRPPQEEQK